MSIRVALVEDDDEIRRQTVARLNAEPDIECVGEYCAAEGLLAAMDHIRPEVVLMSIGLPGQDGIACVRHLKPLYPSVEFVMFTAQCSLVLEAIHAGATGYILKPESPVAAVREVKAGGLPLSADVAPILTGFYHSVNQGDVDEVTPAVRGVLSRFCFD
ncbi:MAG: response regulator transcription factor [Saprospiraceae bacterium]|nr:response regulator transcription factor [Saprospiraceae bacterium]